MQAIPVLYLQKSYIAAHTRKAKDGSVVQVAAYYDKRQKKGAEHAPAHDHPVKHLSGEAQARFDAMHREQHLLHHYQGHALRKRIAEHEGKVKVLQERADAFEKQGAKKSATAMRNKILRHESDLIRHRRALEKVDKHVKALGGMKESLVSGSGKVEPSTDESHQKYVEKLGSPWKPMKEVAKEDPGKLKAKLEMLQYMARENPKSPNIDHWQSEIKRIRGIVGETVDEKPKQKEDEPDTTKWSEAKKSAYALNNEYKENGGFAGSPKDLSAFKRKIRTVAKTIPEDDEHAVMFIDNLATKVWGVDYDPKQKQIEFAPAKTAQAVTKPEPGNEGKAKIPLLIPKGVEPVNGDKQHNALDPSWQDLQTSRYFTNGKDLYYLSGHATFEEPQEASMHGDAKPGRILFYGEKVKPDGSGRSTTKTAFDTSKHKVYPVKNDEKWLKEKEAAVKAQAKPEDTGPQEGERNAEGLVFRNGRWHREEDKTPTQDHPQAATPPGGAKDKAVQDSGIPAPAKADVEIPERTAKDDADYAEWKEKLESLIENELSTGEYKSNPRLEGIVNEKLPGQDPIKDHKIGNYDFDISSDEGGKRYAAKFKEIEDGLKNSPRGTWATFSRDFEDGRVFHTYLMSNGDGTVMGDMDTDDKPWTFDEAKRRVLEFQVFPIRRSVELQKDAQKNLDLIKKHGLAVGGKIPKMNVNGQTYTSATITGINTKGVLTVIAKRGGGQYEMTMGADSLPGYVERAGGKLATLADFRPAMRGEVDIAGQEVPHIWKLVEASELEATRGKADNQFRDRDRAASDEQVQAMAGNLKFKQLAESPIMDYGAPTLAKDGKTVIGGNGRVLAIGKAYSQGKAGNYKAELADNAAKFGFDKADVEGMSQPVLIRVLSKDVDIKQAAIASNEGGGARMSALEQAKVDGERMGDLTDFRPDDSGNLNNAANRDFVRRFMASVPVAQRPAFQSKDGLLSQEGMTRLRNAVLYRAYGDSDVLSRMAEDTDAGQKNLLTALTRMAPVVAQAKADAMVGNLYDLDISADIVAAAHTLAQIKAEGTFSGAEDYFRQQNLFGDTLNDESKQLLIYFDHNLRSAKSLQQFLGDYYQAVQTLGSPRQAGMFGNATPTKQQLLRNASEKRKQTGEEGDLFGKSRSGPSGEGGRQPADASRAEGRDGKGRGEAQGNALGPRVLFFTRPARTAA